MNKMLSACVFAGLSISAFAQGTAIPPDVESTIQTRADRYYATSIRLCEPLRGSSLFERCLSDAGTHRESFVRNRELQYLTAVTAQSSRQGYLDTAERCRKAHSSNCTADLQDAAESYIDDEVDARRYRQRY